MPLGDTITGSQGWRSLFWNLLNAQSCALTHDADNEGHGGFQATATAGQNLLPE